MEDCIFNSMDPAYRNPFGAVSTGTTVDFTIHIPLDLVYATATLVLYDDGMERRIPLEYQQTKNNLIFYHTCFTFDQPGVFFYYFHINRGQENYWVKRGETGKGYLSQSGQGSDYQITVYQKGFQTPDEVKGGLFYQIFPDRFYSSGENIENAPDDRILRSDWGGMPYFLPNEQGEILNNDYFCGDLKGIEQKLNYLESLGVTILYLNPIFEAHSNHRYNTANYLKIDPLLGTEQDFSHLCAEAKKHGIKIILDGVFSHTGSDSIYFNKENRYDTLGAFNSMNSPYFKWFHFIKYPDVYQSWWGFSTLPELNKHDPDYIEFICGKNGVLRHWLRLGTSGFRLDVADELPDEFIQKVREAVKAEGEENLLIGEVWEDASNKIAYGIRRKYFQGKELDSVMNYPFKNAILDFVKDQDKQSFFNKISIIVENYPPQCLHTAMNSISTHDTERAITVIAGESCCGKGREWQSHHQLTISQYRDGINKLKVAMTLQYFLPGIPCLYYGDEAGLQGYKDPFNRGCYPWGQENKALISYCQRLGTLRKTCPGLKDGSLTFLPSPEGIIILKRDGSDGSCILALNYTNCNQVIELTYRGYRINQKIVLKKQSYTIPPFDYILFEK